MAEWPQMSSLEHLVGRVFFADQREDELFDEAHYNNDDPKVKEARKEQEFALEQVLMTEASNLSDLRAVLVLAHAYLSSTADAGSLARNGLVLLASAIAQTDRLRLMENLAELQAVKGATNA